VLVKSDGSYTYVVPDIAYHRDKHNRGFETAVDVWGADHAGYGPRLRAGLVALGLPEDFLDVELVRLVKLVRGGEQVKFSKRAGNIVAFDELMDEVGVDAARYFYVRSSHRTEMNFDLEVAVQQSDENSVFYVQYAHARIASIFRRAELDPEGVREVPFGDFAPEERALLLELLDFLASSRTALSAGRSMGCRPSWRRWRRASTASIPFTRYSQTTRPRARGGLRCARRRSTCSVSGSACSGWRRRRRCKRGGRRLRYTCDRP
jgi:arginyl-tRNA synthetase